MEVMCRIIERRYELRIIIIDIMLRNGHMNLKGIYEHVNGGVNLDMFVLSELEMSVKRLGLQVNAFRMM